MAQTFIYAVTLLLVLWKSVEGQSPFQCNLNHPNLPSAGGQAPFIVASLQQTYTPGSNPIPVFVAATLPIQYTSLIIQAQRVDNPNEVVGSFDTISGFVPVTCGGSSTGTLLSSDTSTKTLQTIMLQWTPPAAGVGNVRFVASVVQALPDGSSQAFIGVEAGNVLMGPDPPAPTAPCDSSPCLNGGSCTNQINGFTCQCFGGFSGDRCQTAPAGVTCATNPCQNGATCFDIPNGVFCNCLPGFTGDRCQTGAGPGPLEISPCPPSINNFGGNTFTWTPPSCSRDGNTLSVSTCDRTQGVFVGAVNPVTCTCQAGDETVTCPFNINATPVGPACAQNPCAAGLDCQESQSALAGYTCHITTGAACPVN